MTKNIFLPFVGDKDRLFWKRLVWSGPNGQGIFSFFTSIRFLQSGNCRSVISNSFFGSSDRNPPITRLAASGLASWRVYLCKTEATFMRVIAWAYGLSKHFLGPKPKRKREPNNGLAPFAKRLESNSSGFLRYFSEKFSDWASTQTRVCLMR